MHLPEKINIAYIYPMKKYFFSKMVILCLTSAACSNQAEDKLKDAEWLVGTWENHGPDGILYETWGKTASGELQGKSYMLNGPDTVFFETMELQHKGPGLQCHISIAGKRDSLPVTFISSSYDGKGFVLENSANDYPQKISYTQIGKDSLYAEISIAQGDPDKKQGFPMKRVQVP